MRRGTGSPGVCLDTDDVEAPSVSLGSRRRCLLDPTRDAGFNYAGLAAIAVAEDATPGEVEVAATITPTKATPAGYANGVRTRFLTERAGLGRAWAWEDRNEQPMGAWFTTF